MLSACKILTFLSIFIQRRMTQFRAQQSRAKGMNYVWLECGLKRGGCIPVLRESSMEEISPKYRHVRKNREA